MTQVFNVGLTKLYCKWQQSYLFVVTARDRQKCMEAEQLWSVCPSLQSWSKALTGFWLSALHVSLATAGRWEKKEERRSERQSQGSAGQFPGSGLWRPPRRGSMGDGGPKPAALMSHCQQIVLLVESLMWLKRNPTFLQCQEYHQYI